MDQTTAKMPLFPSATSQEGVRQVTSLFPAFSASAGTKPSGDSESYPAAEATDWLTNTSFKPEDADIIHNIHSARLRLETGEKDSIDSKTSSGESEAERPVSSSKRHHSPASDSSDESPAKKQKKKKKKKDKHKKKKKKKDKYDEQERRHKKSTHTDRKERSPIPVGTPGGKVFIEEMSSLLKVPYRLDRKPDQDNLRFLQLYKLRIAQYRRFGQGCLGLQQGETLKLEGDRKKDSKKFALDLRYFTKVKHSKSAMPVVIVPGRSQKEEGSLKRKSRFDQKKTGNNDSDFIAMDKEEVKEYERRANNPLGVYDQATQCYLEGKAPDTQTDQNPIVNDEDEVSLQEIEVLSRTAQFNKHLLDHPNDIDKWLEFVDFQNEAITADLSLTLSNNKDSSAAKKPMKSAVLEIKLSILEQAIKRNPASVRLKMKQLELCNDHWEPAKLDKEWERLVFSHPNNTDIWWQRLLHLQSSVSLFTVGRLVKVYGKCLGLLTAIRDGTFTSHSPGPHFEEHIFAIFEQLVRVLLHSGHTEKALALLQATVEINLFCPQVLRSASRDDKLQFLENFWDSGMPRSGETGALGFSTWMERNGEVPFCSMYSKEAEIEAEDAAISGAASRSDGWLHLEASRSNRHLFAWRPDSKNGETEEDCEDLERIVMLDDLSPCLVIFDSERCQFSLVIAYIEMLGVRLVQHGGFLSTDRMAHRTLRSGLESLSQVHPAPVLTSPSELYASPTELTYRTATNLLVQIQTAKIFTGHYATFVNLALIEVRKQHLGFKQSIVNEKEWKGLCKDLRKGIKSVLKETENRNNLLLWEQYVDVEWALGSMDDARRIVFTALSMTPVPKIGELTGSYTDCVTCKLYRHYAEVELGLNTPSLLPDSYSEATMKSVVSHSVINGTLYVLTTLADSIKFTPSEKPDEPVPATRILRARSGYQSTLEALLLQQGDKATWSHSAVLRALPQAGTLLAHWTTCFALFQYLTLGLGPALAVHEQVRTKLQTLLGNCVSDTTTQNDLYMDDQQLYYQSVYEDLMKSMLNLLKYHMQTSVISTSVLRSPLQSHLSKFPDSAFLLNMYIDLEAATNIVGRLCRQLHGLTGTCHTPLVWIYGILADLRRRERSTREASIMDDIPEWLQSGQTPGGGSQHQLRAWLERAVNHSTGRHCVLLWRLYLRFEVGEGETAKAKSVYYRAIAQCPAAKSLYVDFIRAFPDRLEEVTDLMLEKELRLRTPLEEIDVLLPQFKPRPQSKNEDDYDIPEDDADVELDTPPHSDYQPVTPECGPTEAEIRPTEAEIGPIEAEIKPTEPEIRVAKA